MTTHRLRFCLVTSAHVCNNPRLVKEADALHAAGHDVRVVAVDARADFAARDDLLMRSRRWALERVAVGRHGPLPGRARWGVAAAKQALARRAVRAGLRWPSLVDQAESRFLSALSHAAARAPADVFIAHNLPALPAAARAAARRGARLGFDAEDLHVDELPDDAAHAAEREMIADVERRYLPRCDRLTASSEGIADRLAERYRVRRPYVVHNVFAAGDAPHGRRSSAPGRAPSLYWYSQTVGAGRGLEDAIAALGLLVADGREAQLHIRGAVDATYAPELAALLRRHGVERHVRLLPLAPADEMIALASEHDVGLALEQPDTLNRALCVTNKLFTYLAAGVAVAATDTPGQRTILATSGEAGFLYPPGDAWALADGLRRLLDDPAALDAAKRAARAAAETRYSWEHEGPGLVRYLCSGAPPVQHSGAAALAGYSRVGT